MKSPIAVDIRALIVSRLNDSTPQEVLRIASAIAANEQIEAMSSAYTHPLAKAAPSVAPPRFVNLDGDGKRVTGNHGWVFDRTTGLVWSRAVLAGEFTFADAQKACEKVTFMGRPCRASTVQERFSITDFTKHSPALDTAHFAKESGWEWTSTPDAESPSGYAWSVNLGYGLVYRYYQSGRYHVRPVLAGQNLNFDF